MSHTTQSDAKELNEDTFPSFYNRWSFQPNVGLDISQKAMLTTSHVKLMTRRDLVKGKSASDILQGRKETRRYDSMPGRRKWTTAGNLSERRAVINHFLKAICFPWLWYPSQRLCLQMLHHRLGAGEGMELSFSVKVYRSIFQKTRQWKGKLNFGQHQ